MHGVQNYAWFFRLHWTTYQSISLASPKYQTDPTGKTQLHEHQFLKSTAFCSQRITTNGEKLQISPRTAPQASYAKRKLWLVIHTEVRLSQGAGSLNKACSKSEPGRLPLIKIERHAGTCNSPLLRWCDPWATIELHQGVLTLVRSIL